jgi:hypothetical protein
VVLPDSRGIPRVPRYLGSKTGVRRFSGTGLLPSVVGLSRPLLLNGGFFTPWCICNCTPLAPLHPLRIAYRLYHVIGLGSSRFARRYFGNRSFFLFLELLRCFSSLGCPRHPMCSDDGDGVLPPSGFPIRASPGHNACLRLPEAFRCLPRPSSTLSAKASSVCSF